jgi:hypothetical protein
MAVGFFKDSLQICCGFGGNHGNPNGFEMISITFGYLSMIKFMKNWCQLTNL